MNECPHCWKTLYSDDKEEIDWNNVDWISHELNPMCPNCETDIAFGDVMCVECSMTYDEDFWRDFYSDYLDEIYYEEAGNVKDPFEGIDDLVLCCGIHWASCKCKIQLDFKDITNQIPAMTIFRAYSIDSECGNCLYQGEAQCFALRQWIKEYAEDNKEPSWEIDDCSNFRHILPEMRPH